MRFFALTLCGLLMIIPPAAAQQDLSLGARTDAQGDWGYGMAMAYGEDAATPPTEPYFPKITYKEPESPRGVNNRIDALLFGAKMYVSPEYDHFGYEIRRYMAHVGNPEAMNDPEKLVEELKNVKRAKIVLSYWQQNLQEQKDAIEADIETKNASSSVRTLFKYNSGVASAFIGEIQQWLNNNEDLLQFLAERQGLYQVKYPDIIFDKQEDRYAFDTLFRAREKALEFIKEYQPFAMMVY